jgi:Beta-lactamase class C and other penicillin binding proteins
MDYRVFVAALAFCAAATLALVLAIVARAPGSASARGELPSCGDAAISTILVEACRRAKVPAMAAAVVTGDGLRSFAAAGFRKWGGTEPAGLDDLWHLGSDTKVMTSVLVATFVEEGRLSWDSKVADTFPELAPRFRPEYRGVTMAQLLSHSAGLPHDIDYRALTRLGPIREQRVGAIAAAFSQKPLSPPGSTYSYSNVGYVIVGAMCERVGGADWEDLMRDRVFSPLGMSSAGFGGLGAAGEESQPWGHRSLGRRPRPDGAVVDNPAVLGPAGRVHCSIQDWATFIADQLRGGRGEKALLRPESYRTIQSARSPRVVGDSSDYGLGWAIVERPWAGGIALTHSGCNLFYYAVAWLAPAKDFAVLVCANAGLDAAGPTDRVASWIVASLAGAR